MNDTYCLRAHRSGVIFVAMLAIAVNVVGGLFFREHAIARAGASNNVWH
jgi:Co/Zn/Cd efflux system component